MVGCNDIIKRTLKIAIKTESNKWLKKSENGSKTRQLQIPLNARTIKSDSLKLLTPKMVPPQHVKVFTVPASLKKNEIFHRSRSDRTKLPIITIWRNHSEMVLALSSTQPSSLEITWRTQSKEKQQKINLRIILHKPTPWLKPQHPQWENTPGCITSWNETPLGQKTSIQEK